MKNFFKYTLIAFVAIAMASCGNKKFNVKGQITNAKDSTLFLENMGLDGVSVVDSVKLSQDGTFSFSPKAGDEPNFYRLRIDNQTINISVDSTETIEIKAQWPNFSTQYDVQGSQNCQTIKTLTLKQMQLQQTVSAIYHSPNLGTEAAQDSANKIIEAYKNEIKNNYIFKAPMNSSSYFALFQTISIDGNTALIFNPRSSEEDVKAFAAVATSWDVYHPKSIRGQNLHNIAIEGMKTIRIMRAQQQMTIDPSKVNTSNNIDIVLTDNKGKTQSLSSLKGKVVLLDFHIFASPNSTKRIMMLRDLYNKYHNKGFEIYQVSLDPDEHFWKTQTASLPWISVREPDAQNAQSIVNYNVQQVPTFFLIDKNNVVYKRDVQIKDLDAEISKLY